MFARLVILCCFMLTNACVYSTEASIQDLKEIRKQKKVLEESIWIVPPNTLLAYSYSNGETKAISAQTVWVITKYDDGYFFGDSYTSIDSTPTSHTKIVGTVTPSGSVSMTFYPKSGNLLTKDIVNAVGKLKYRDEFPTFTVQMNTPQNNSSGIVHWAYLIKVNPDHFFYQELPGVNISVPEFISKFQP